MDQIKEPEIRNLIITFQQRVEGIALWVEDKDDCPFSVIHAAVDASKALKVCERRSLLVRQLSLAPFLFYRFANGPRLWNIVEEDFRVFGATEAWMEDSPYPRSGDVKRWMEAL